MKAGHAAQKMIICIETFGRLARGAFYLDLFQLRRDRADDAGSQLVLQIENVAQVPIVAFRPNVIPLLTHRLAVR